MKRYVSALLLAAATAFACVNVSGSGPQLLLVVAPVLDSVFVGDTLPARSVYLDDGAGHHSDPGPITWTVSPLSVATIDAATGRVAGVAKGTAIVVATRTDGVATRAVVNVSRPLEMTLQLDTIVVMPGDTITVPLAIKQRAPGLIDPPTVRFDSSATPSVYSIDTLSGRITAVGTGGPVRYVARLTDGTNTVIDSGAVVVVTLTDTSETGRSFMTVFGTAIRHQRGVPLARNYRRLNFKQAFQLADTVYLTPTSGAIHERVLITLPDSVVGPGTFEIDSISPQQATTLISQLNPYCQPKFPWALWYSILPTPGIRAYSHGTPSDSVAGQLTITRFVPALVSGGTIISGRYEFTVRRTDLYDDPLGSETIRGTFVAPLWTDGTTCGS
jgi:hypothetical protein